MPRRVNRCLNPVVGSTFGLIGTSGAGSGAATTRGVDATFGRTVASSYKVTWTAAAAGGWCYINWGESTATNPPVTPGEALTFWVWVFTQHADIGAFACIQYCNSSYGQIANLIGSTSYGLNDGQWHQIKIDTVAPAGAAYARLQVQFLTQSAGPVGSSAWATDLLFAPTAQGGQFAYGGSPGWRWTGLAHQSTSQELRGVVVPGLLLPV